MTRLDINETAFVLLNCTKEDAESARPSGWKIMTLRLNDPYRDVHRDIGVYIVFAPPKESNDGEVPE